MVHRKDDNHDNDSHGNRKQKAFLSLHAAQLLSSLLQHLEGLYLMVLQAHTKGELAGLRGGDKAAGHVGVEPDIMAGGKVCDDGGKGNGPLQPTSALAHTAANVIIRYKPAVLPKKDPSTAGTQEASQSLKKACKLKSQLLMIMPCSSNLSRAVGQVDELHPQVYAVLEQSAQTSSC